MSEPTEPSLVLTVSVRLARWLTLKYNEDRLNEGLEVWDAPAILPLDTWLKQVWVESLPDRRLLSDLQARKIWETIIRQSLPQEDIPLIHLASSAEQAKEAYQIIVDYGLTASPPDLILNEETRQFFKWKRCYEKRLAELNAIDPALLLTSVHKKMEQGEIAIPPRISLSGYLEAPPRLMDWVKFLQRKGCAAIWDEPPTDSQFTGTELRSYKNRKNEVVQCARWIRSIYSSDKTIGVVVSSLDQYRSLIAREFKMELTPNSVSPEKKSEPPFNISLGTPLAKEPMIWTGMQILNSTSALQPLSALALLIKSPFFACGRNHFADAIVLEQEWSSHRMNALNINSAPPSPFDVFFKSWIGYLSQNKERLPSQWAKLFFETLTEMGWPGEEDFGWVSADDYQIYSAWKECLDNLSSLDDAVGSLTKPRAITILNQILTERLFQAKTRERPIQIVGLLESSGMRFDHLWVMGCHSETFPTPASPNPFLPLSVQKRAGVVHADPDWERKFAQQSLERLSAAADQVIFSYPEMDGTKELQLSPLLSGVPISNQAPIETSSTLQSALQSQSYLETWQDSPYLPFTPEEHAFYSVKNFPGGSGALRDQAACPFRAFSAYRLQLKNFDIPENDYDQSERGSIVHKTLEYFWKEIRSQKKLKDLIQSNTLDEILWQAIKKTFESSSARKIKWQPLFSAVEQKRVFALVRDWLEKENTLRTDDFIVLKQEGEVRAEINGLKLKLYIDRIDQTENGQIILIDYKTSDNHGSALKRWFEDRLEEPQLPLYSIAKESDAVAIALLLKNKSQLRPVGDLNLNLPNLEKQKQLKIAGTEDWNAIRERWETQLNNLAQELIAGRLHPDPLHKAQTCKNCNYTTLCRIIEASDDLAFAEDEDD
ncbi:MAG: hypothetical protein COV66_12815 [Nitrospinae bacterium CG11_big_fil_rev_8_21_14_0_20_45_15]|nr:MAG: hypothetical protein COV66_12815 [Nitrospinae bacterium CG11_big_fil_rev_8_21_14_0_20_45_15]